MRSHGMGEDDDWWAWDGEQGPERGREGATAGRTRSCGLARCGADRPGERDATRGARDALKRGALGRGAGDRPSPTLGDRRTDGHTVSKRLMPLVGNPLTSIKLSYYEG